MAKREMDAMEIMGELGALFKKPNDPGLETLREFLEEPLGYYDDFEIARLAEAFEQLGSLLKIIVRNNSINRFSDKNKEEERIGVKLRWRSGSPDSVRVDTDKVKVAFPKKEYPNLYKPNPIGETVMISIKRRY